MDAFNEAEASLPRILCLHGGGTSAEIFQIQCRVIIKRLKGLFRLVFVDAPFTSRPHPAIVPYFGDDGTFYRWLRWNDDEPYDSFAEAKILDCIETAMRTDAGTGAWVGVMGFSQGAKMAASLLWSQEKLRGAAGEQGPFRFGVFMAGRAPVVVLDPEQKLPRTRYTAHIDELSTSFQDWAPNNEGEHALATPTLHVHGLQDPGLDMHRALLKDYCKTGTTRLVEWDGGHRLPIQAADVEKVVVGILAMAAEAGVLKN
jgi:predicted esterase